jgi:molybdate transport system substrate-binding protein
MFSRRSFVAAVTTFGGSVFAPTVFAEDTELVIFAASSLKTALDKVAAAWTLDTKKETSLSYAASSALARQIESGAPADVFMSADTDWMSYLTDKKLVAAEGVVNLLGNEIVLIAPKQSTTEIKLEQGLNLAAVLGNGKLAMADVKAVPAGKYGKAALESLGAWTDVEPQVAQAENVRAALKLVATGEAPLGIVYATDARAEPSVKIIASFPASSHPPIIYPVAAVASSGSADAKAFVAFLRSPEALDIFKAEGFTSLVP